MVARKKVSKALAVKDDNLPSNIMFDQSLMENQEIDNEDILIPKIWLMQGQSDLVIAKVAAVGEFRDSLTSEKLEEPLEVFLFAPYKTWQVSVTPKGKKNSEYVETLNYYENADLEIEEEDENGGLIHRDKVLGFFCLIASTMTVEPFPYVIDFKRTSRRAGQALITKIAKLRAHKMPCYAKSFIINSKSETNDLGTYAVKTVETGRNITQEEALKVEEWIKTIKQAQEQKNIQVDDTDIKKEAAQKAKPAKRTRKASNKQKF